MHKSIHSLWSVVNWLHFEGFWEVFVVVMKNFQTLHVFSDEVLWSIFWFGYSRAYMHSLLTLTEMVLFKIVYIFKYSRIAAMNEYFLTFFITSFNFVVIFGSTIIRILLKEYAGTRRYFHQFAKPYEVYKKVEIP